MERSLEEVKARSEAAWKRKRQWYSLWDECYEYASPGMNPFHTMIAEGGGAAGYMTGGQPEHNMLFDGELAYLTDKLSHRMMYEAFPPGRDWAELSAASGLGGDAFRSDSERSGAAKKTQNVLFSALRASNVNLEILRMGHDGVVSGTGVLMGGLSKVDSSVKLHFEAVSQAEIAIEAGARGQIWGIYRKMDLPREQAIAMWPEAKGKIPPPRHDLERSGEPPVDKYIEATYYDPMSGRWHYNVDLQGSQDGGDAIRVVKKTYAVSPWMIWRFMLRPGEVWGRCPVMAALPAARTANKAKRTELELASIRVGGIWTYTNDGVFNPNNVRMESGTFLPVMSNAHDNPQIRPLDLPGDPQFGQVILENEHAHLRQVMLDDALPPMTGAVRSATEIMERQRSALLALGLPYQRLQEEIGRHMLRLAAYLLMENDELPELKKASVSTDGVLMPLKLDGTDIHVTFLSPLNQMQVLDDAMRIVQWADLSMRSAGPRDYAIGVRTEAIPEVLGEKFRIPDTLIVPEGERQSRAQMQSELAQPPAAEQPMTEGAAA